MINIVNLIKKIDFKYIEIYLEYGYINKENRIYLSKTIKDSYFVVNLFNKELKNKKGNGHIYRVIWYMIIYFIFFCINNYVLAVFKNINFKYFFFIK